MSPERLALIKDIAGEAVTHAQEADDCMKQSMARDGKAAFALHTQANLHAIVCQALCSTAEVLIKIDGMET